MSRLSELIPDFVVTETLITNVLGTAWKQIAAADPTRFSIGIFATASNTAFLVSLQASSNNTQGWLSNLQTAQLAVTFRDFPLWVNQTLYGRSLGAAISLTVVEVFYRPQNQGFPLGQMADYLNEVGSP